MLKRFLPWFNVIVATLALSVLVAGCQKMDAPTESAAQPAAAPAPPSPPPPPQTSFGRLVKVERAEKTPVEAMTLNGIRKSEGRASKGKTFLILSFEGKSCRAGDELIAMVSVGADGVMARTDERSWVTDSLNKKHSPGIPVAAKNACQLAFEIPTEASELIWHDGKKKAYSLEPYPVELPAPAANTTGAPTKSQ